ncbi:MAG: hypothetical protein HKN72_04675 [Gemmatimonadetes bacterium]|nr:PD40 domain-containing protein [Gemmatimonadota bacterium]NNF12489.1 hypothetical protein [Gemmatimonadota bacterium]NNL29602.1 hypothetical protein [Gemmatimonadota bacterium]
MSAAPEEPTQFAPGVISTQEREYGITFTPDGREAYFTRRSRRGPSRIMVTRWEEGGWTEPERASFAAERDEAPFITAAGDTLFFVSRRPIGGSFDRSENIWYVQRGMEGWSEPEPLRGTVNLPRGEIDDFTVGTELGPTLTPEGALLYWTRTSPDWGSDIYVAEPDDSGAFIDPRPLRLNSPGEELNPAISPDGRLLVFQGYRGGGIGDDDLYVSRRTDFGWEEPELLPPPINSGDSEGHPRFSPDGRLLFFSSDRGGGFDDIYVVSVAALGGFIQ